MNSGKRTVLLTVLAAFGLLGPVAEDSMQMVRVAPELLEPGVSAGCSTDGEDLAKKGYVRAASETGLVHFQWNAATGELSFSASAATSALRLPEEFVTVALTMPVPRCESR